MQLRQKFSLIALVYLLSLFANLILAACCIIIYFNSAFGEFETSLSREDLVEQARSLLRGQLNELSSSSTMPDKRVRYGDIEKQLDGALSGLRSSAMANAPEL